ncbi:MAG: hypothetical protein ABIJ09_13505 [Pseudomonadota bacterium]
MRTVVLLTLLLAATTCTKDGDPGYTALMRYAVSDFRIAGIDARPVDSSATLPLSPGQPIQLRALVLSVTDQPVELEWLDCPSYAYGSADSVSGTVDCLGTPRELRLGRGEHTTYTYTIPDLPPQPWERDGGWEVDEAGVPIVPEAGPGPEERPDPVPYDDAIVYLRATQGDQVRYARKFFFALFTPDPMRALRRPFIDGLRVSDHARGLDDDAPLRASPGDRLTIRFSVVDIEENRPVQWFVSGGELSRRGLTLYQDRGMRDTNLGPVPVLGVDNTWTLPRSSGRHQLYAVVGGDFGPLPFVRLDVEVK